MITGQQLTALLHSLSTGFPDRALNIVVTHEDLDDGLRRLVYSAISDHVEPWLQAQAVGDVLRDAKADQALINECYRCAFYLGAEWTELVSNPLYARFVANRAGPILDKWVHYFPIYARHLDRFRGRPVRVLEIGVYGGGGLDLWQDYLGPQATLVGLDIDEAAVRAVGGRFPVVLGDQEDPEVLRELEAEHGPFDIVIDDGGHAMRQQIVSVETLFPLLADGGAYLVEDTHTSYWQEFGGALHDPGTFLEWSKRRVDDMHSRHSSDIDRTTVWATHLDGLHMYDSVVVLEKARRHRPFNEIVGTSSYLFGARFSENVGIELLATRGAVLAERDGLRERIIAWERDATAEPSTVRGEADATREELRLARSELQRAHERAAVLHERLDTTTAQLDRTRSDLLDSWNQLTRLRKTLSWRVTSPLRAARRLRER
ncbi:MAG: class I SAM-dependent methyltransferase [Nocardioidaceae bacterium]